MKETIGCMKARIAMLWSALTARNCVVTWLEDGKQYLSYVVYEDEITEDFWDGIDLEPK